MNRVLKIVGEPKLAAPEEVGLKLEPCGSQVAVKLVRADGSEITGGYLIRFRLDANGRVTAERFANVNTEYVALAEITAKDPVVLMMRVE